MPSMAHSNLSSKAGWFFLPFETLIYLVKYQPSVPNILVYIFFYRKNRINILI